MSRHINAVIAQHPRHQHALLHVLNQSSKLSTIARLIGEKCRELGITDFTNPFNGVDDELKAVWSVNFGLQSQEQAVKNRVDAVAADKANSDARAAEGLPRAPEPEEPETPEGDADAPFDYKAATKEQIEQHVFEATGVNLNTRMKKADLIKKAKTEIKKAA